jgi:hypothetical protein
MDIKNIIEVLDAVEVVVIPVKEALKDGLDLSDLPKALDIIKKHEVILAALDNIGEVIEEGKDIDPTEAAIIAAKVIALIKALKA